MTVAHEHARFGFWDLGLRFREIVRFEESALVTRDGRSWPWRDVIALRAYPNFVGGVLGSLMPLLIIYFADGSALLIRGRHLRSACRECPVEKKAGLPGPYVEVIQHLRARGVGDWEGPREEILLIQMAMGLGIFGFALAYGLTAQLNLWPRPVELAIPVGVIAGNLAFLLLPAASRMVRRRFLSAKALLAKPRSPGA